MHPALFLSPFLSLYYYYFVHLVSQKNAAKAHDLLICFAISDLTIGIREDVTII